MVKILEGMPDGAAVTLPVQWLRAQLVDDGKDAAAEDSIADLSVSEVAAELGRSPATIRSWCSAGEIPGAYKLKNREWRIPRPGYRKFFASQRNRARQSPPRRRRHAELGAWREQLSETAAIGRKKGLGAIG